MKFIYLAILLMGFSTQSWASGYQLRYQGAESMSTAFASQGSYGNSLSSIYFNPALFLMQSKKQAAAVELFVGHPTQQEFTTGGQSFDDFVSTTFSGSLYYGYMIDDSTAITVALITPWGVKTEYDKNWVGRNFAIKTDLKGINLQPVISKKLNDKLALSIGPQIQYMMGTLSQGTSALPGGILSFEGTSLSAGAVAGITYTPTKKTTITLNYQSQIKHHLRGDLDVTPDNPGLVDSDDADTTIITPDILTLGASHMISEKLIGHLSFSYTQWSLFEELHLKANKVVGGAGALPSAPVELNWKDTYFVALGATFNSSDSLSLRGGVSYETSALENEFRTPRTLDSDRISVGLGAGIGLAESLNMDIAFNQIFYISDMEITGSNGPAGTFDLSSSLLRVGVEYKF